MRLKDALCFAILSLLFTGCATRTVSKPESPHGDAIAQLEDQAYTGDAEAMNRLGVAYETGTRGVAQDYGKAAYWFGMGHIANNAEATANLGYLYLQGTGVDKDLPAARALFEQAAGADNLMGICNFANMLVDGLGGPQDLPRAWTLLAKGADAGAAACQTTLGLAYRYGRVTGKRDLVNGKKYLILAANQGNQSAKAEVAGFVFEENPDDEPKQREAIEQLVVLANQGETQADVILAKACFAGTPWPPDGRCARRHLENACKNGFPRNCAVLGTILQTDFGGPSDLVAAERELRTGLAAGAPYAGSDLGRLLMHEDRAAEAVPLLLTAASELHDVLAMYTLLRHCRAQSHCKVADAQLSEMRQKLRSLTAVGKNNLAWRISTDPLSDIEDAKYAIRLMRMVSSGQDTDWRALGTLAAAHARAANFKAAIHWQLRSIAAMQSNSSNHEKKNATAQLERFKNGEPIDWY